ncbi:MAG: CDP-glycerol glycerophosphotransferase family protein, partial [Pirellulaceae bacterium]|nr:CDP-glycerol glycerophosphotransferase family protein [Pirellulaceae bacterium]
MYFFKYCSRVTQTRMVWLTRSDEILKTVRREGYEAYKTNSFKGLWFGFRARWHVFDVSLNDTNRYSSRGAKLLNLWHGYPVKDFRNFGLKTKKQKASYKSKIWDRVCNYPSNNENYYFVHQNRKYLWQITEAFDVQVKNVIIANYPRNIVFEDSDEAKSYTSENAIPWIKKLEQIRNGGKRVLGYFPTWRGDNDDTFMGTRDSRELERLNEILAANNLVLATKWHSCVFKAYGHKGTSSSAEALNETMNSLSNVVVLGFEQDLNSLLNQCDLLISDYSGVIVDFLLADRPQVFMAYDLERYRQKYGFVFDYENFAPGPIGQTIEELIIILS